MSPHGGSVRHEVIGAYERIGRGRMAARACGSCRTNRLAADILFEVFVDAPRATARHARTTPTC